MQNSAEHGKYSVNSFHEMMTIYEKGDEFAVSILSNFLARLWKEFNGGNIDNTQKKKRENIERELFSAIANGFEYCNSGDSGQKELGVKIFNAAQAVIDEKPSVFAEELCGIFGIKVVGEAFISGKSSYREIDMDSRIVRPLKQSIGGASQKIIRIKEASAIGLLENLPLLEKEKTGTNKEVPEWAINLASNLTQLIQEFKELCKNLPIPSLKNFAKFQIAQKELDLLRYRLEELYKIRDRYSTLQSIVKATEERVAYLQESTNSNNRREKRLESNEKRLKTQRDELFKIEIRKLAPEIKSLEIRYKSVKKQLGSLFEKLQYTQGELRGELEKQLDYRMAKHSIVKGGTIDTSHLQDKAIGIITQISYEQFPEWKGVRNTLTRLESKIKSGFFGEDSDDDETLISQKRSKEIMHKTLAGIYTKAVSKVPKTRIYKRK